MRIKRGPARDSGYRYALIRASLATEAVFQPISQPNAQNAVLRRWVDRPRAQNKVNALVSVGTLLNKYADFRQAADATTQLSHASTAQARTNHPSADVERRCLLDIQTGRSLILSSIPNKLLLWPGPRWAVALGDDRADLRARASTR